ncbi:MAG: hypothetical protein LBE12_16520 [Planctomycetaceae bacterium]|nr:hypothetical protein [Planctomycetaceae bacterium]
MNNCNTDRHFCHIGLLCYSNIVLAESYKKELILSRAFFDFFLLVSQGREMPNRRLCCATPTVILFTPSGVKSEKQKFH